MELNLFSLKVFLKVAESKSISEAAASLFLSQPAVSLQIQNLESFFRTLLIVRNPSGRLALSEAGLMLHKRASEFLKLEENLLAEMESFSSTPLRGIRIGACCIAGEHLMPVGLGKFKEKFQGVRLSFDISKCEKVFSGLLSGAYDVGITGAAPRNKVLVKKKLIEVPLVFFESRRDGVAYPRTISLEEMMDSPWIMREEGSGCRKVVETFLAKQRIKMKKLEIVAVSESNDAIKQLVRSGAGLSFLPQFMISDEIDSGVFGEIRLTAGSPQQAFYVVHRKAPVLSREQKELIGFLLDHHDGHRRL
jgi:LysR family transcriptional regulator, transcriptional activator of the cysJI operon